MKTKLALVLSLLICGSASAQDSLNVSRLWQQFYWQTAYSVAVQGNYAFIAAYDDGLVIYDITNPAAPDLTGIYDTQGNARGIAVAGSYAYVADGYGGLRVLTSPCRSRTNGFYNTPDCVAFGIGELYLYWPMDMKVCG